MAGGACDNSKVKFLDRGRAQTGDSGFCRLHLTQAVSAIIGRSQWDDTKRDMPPGQPRSQTVDCTVTPSDNYALNWLSKGPLPILLLNRDVEHLMTSILQLANQLSTLQH